MQYKWSIISIALLVALLPFLGFPGVVRDWFITIGGLCIVLLVFFGNEIAIFRRKDRTEVNHSDSYVENENTSSGDSSALPPKV